MAYEKLHSLIERLNVDGVKSEFDAFPELNGGYQIVKVTCTSDDKNYIASLVKGMQQFFDEKLEIKSEAKLTTPVEFFKPTKPQQYFHYITLDQGMFLKLCEKFKVSYDEIEKDCEGKININSYGNPNKPR